MTPQEKIHATIHALPINRATEIYTGMRLFVMTERRAGRKPPESLTIAMEESGTALANIIGETEFYALVERIDNHVYGEEK